MSPCGIRGRQELRAACSSSVIRAPIATPTSTARTLRAVSFSRVEVVTPKSEETAMKSPVIRKLLGSLVLAAMLAAAVPARNADAQMTLGSLSVHGSTAVGVYPQPVPNTNV